MSKVARQMEMSRRAVNLIHRRAIQKLGARDFVPDAPVEVPSAQHAYRRAGVQ